MINSICFTNAQIWKEGSFDPHINSIMCRNGLIDRLFTMDAPITSECLVIDLKGSCLYPGFIDTHTHSFEGGLYSNGLDLSHCNSVDEVQDAIRDKRHAIIQSGGNLLIAWRLDENRIREKRFPTVHELDEVCNDIPLLLRRIDGHSCIVNSCLISMMNKEGIEFPEAQVYRGSANDLIVHWLHAQCNEETILQAYSSAAKKAMAGGFTTIHTMIGDAQNSITHYSLIRQNLPTFPIEFVIYPQSFNIAAALDAGATRIGGCILADGSIGSHTAALSEPYIGQLCNQGKLYHTDEFWYGFISQAHQSGLQVAVHCIGDRAISQINNIYMQLHRSNPQDLRHQLIHCELTPDSLVGEIAASSAICVMQPAFDLLWGGTDGLYERTLGTERSKRMNRFNTLMSKGITVTGGSDWYVTELDIRLGLKGAIMHNSPNERLNVSAAIDIYTKNAAYLSHDESRLGKIAEGYQADFSILNHPFDEDSDFDSLEILAIVKEGKLVYDRYSQYC